MAASRPSSSQTDRCSPARSRQSPAAQCRANSAPTRATFALIDSGNDVFGNQSFPPFGAQA